jgi:hypothetical protein
VQGYTSPEPPLPSSLVFLPCPRTQFQAFPVPEIIDPVFVKTCPIRSFSRTENERFGHVFTKTGSINSGTVNHGFPLVEPRKSACASIPPCPIAHAYTSSMYSFLPSSHSFLLHINYAPVIYSAPCIMFWMRAYPLGGHRAV